MTTAATSGSTRKSLGDIYRPQGPKLVQSGLAWTSGGSANIAQAIDLSLPIRGMRLVFKGRLVIGTAAFTSVNPEGFLNLISNIVIQGTNARQRGNITLWNADLATAWVMAHLYNLKANRFTISTTGAGGDATVPAPGTPFPGVGVAVPNQAAGYINGATGTYDFVISVDFPFHPHALNQLGKSPNSVVGFLVRNEEWKDSLQLQMTYGAQAGAGATGVLGVSAGTTTVTFSGYLGVGAAPTIDVYSLPVLMGLDLKDTVLPGIYSRITQPINTILQAAGQASTTLLNLQKQPTARIIVKTGTSTVSPAFATLADTTILTSLGLSLGGNRNVRNNVDLISHKHQQTDVHGREPIQGYTLLDFMDGGNYDAAFPGQDIGDGATFQLVGAPVGVANGFGLIVQEQMIHTPTGPLLNY